MMNYSGRILIVSITLLMIVIVRAYGFIYYNIPLIQVPFIGTFILLASWVLGTQYDKLKFLSEKDHLTTLYNRRFIQDTFSKLIASVDRKQEKLVIYFIDVDNFKLINDSRGHSIGDQVLQRIANILMRYVNKKDITARWAGDEFLILSASSDIRTQELLITHIQQALALASQEFHFEISVSIGTAVYPNDAQSLDDLLHAADQDMYTSKSDRKNKCQVVVGAHS